MLPLIRITLVALPQIINLLLQLNDFLTLNSMFVSIPETIHDVFYLPLIVIHVFYYVNRRLPNFLQSSSMVRFPPLGLETHVQYIASAEILLNDSLFYQQQRLSRYLQLNYQK